MTLSGHPQLFCFTFGHEPVSEALSLRGGDPNVFLLEPVTGAAVAYEDGWVLIDTGFNVDTIRDPVKRAAHYNFECYTALIPRGDPLLQQVAAAGLRWADLKMCLISHLHCDHSGGLKHVAGTAPVYLQRREYEFAVKEAGVQHAYFRDDYELAGLEIKLLDGPAQLAAGLSAIPTYGHTPGHMSFRVDLRDTGPVVLACDAADLMSNITTSIPCGSTTHPALESDAATSIALLHRMATNERVQVWPGHDPDFWATRLKPPDSYQ